MKQLTISMLTYKAPSEPNIPRDNNTRLYNIET